MPEGLWPGLWVIATPIGNLGDLTSRARAALAGADAVLCEDTRRTARLLTALAIPAPRLERFDAHARPEQIEAWVERLGAGESLAVVTDAGTPGISDPAARLVAAARAAGARVVPVPGPSAVAALLSVAGFDETEFCFRGFFPRKREERSSELETCAASASARVHVWFESPERVAGALELAAGLFPQAAVVAAKELTKLHEKIFGGSAAQVSERVSAEVVREGAVGEWCFAIRFEASGRKPAEADPAWLGALECLLDVPVPASDAARRVSQYFGVPRNTVYEAALRLSGKKI